MINKNYESIIIKNPKLPLLFCCDHASNLIPKEYNQLGLNKSILKSHIAYDVGAKILTKALSKKFNTHAILGKYSRLFIDLNREKNHKNLIPEISDEVIIPNNINLTKKEYTYRKNYFHKPYHKEISNKLQEMDKLFLCKTALICIHSFTSSLKDRIKRPWEIGLLYRKDESLYNPIIKSLKMNNSFKIGENKPYSGFDDVNYTMTTHGEKNKRPFISIEIRNDIFEKNNIKNYKKLLGNISEAIFFSQLKLGKPYNTFAKKMNLF
jgi:predicted N-formylglutamate amidohydrolase